MELNNSTLSSKDPKTPLHQNETADRSQETTGDLPAFETNSKGILLNQAMFKRDVKTLKELLECGADVNAVGDDGDTPLHLGLAYSGIVACVKEIVCGTGVIVNNYENPASLIRVASCTRDTTIVEELLRSHVGVNAVDIDSNTSLSLVYDEIVQCITELLEHGADVNVTNRKNRNSLHTAVLYKTNMEVFKTLLRHGANVHAVDDDGNTPLRLSFNYLVILEDAKEMLKYLANVNSVNFKSTISLHKAVPASKHLEMVKELLRYGADVNAVDKDGNTALHLGLVSRANGQFVKELLEHGANVRITNCKGETPLHTAILYTSDVNIIKELLRRGANVNAADMFGNTPLRLGVNRDVTVECVKELLAYGAKVNLANLENQTPSHAAAPSKVNIKVIEILLRSRATTHIIDYMRQTPLRSAMPYFCSVLRAKVLIKNTLFHTVVHNYKSFFNLNQCKHFLNYRFVAQYSNDCVSELTKMKTMKVNDRLSLYDFVATATVSTPLYLDDESSPIIKQEEKLISNFVIYRDVILLKVKHALFRSRILKKLKTVCIYSWNFNSLADGRGEKVVLNEDCTSVLAKWLTNNDLCKLMMAFSNCNQSNSESCTSAIGLENEKFKKRFCEACVSTCMKKARLE